MNLQAPVLVSGVVCSPASLGQSAVSTCTATTTQPALTGGASLTLASNNTLLTVPATVTVAAGATAATFSATAAATIPTNQSATVTTMIGSSSQTATISLQAPVLVSGVACSPASLGQGAVSTCTVTLKETAPTGGSSVTLSSSNTLLTVAATVTVAAGATTATFSATAAASISSNQSATITATLGASSKTATISLQAPVLVSGVVCFPTSLGQSAVSTCTVTLTQTAPAGGSKVTLATNNALLTVPGTVKVAAGATTATFGATASASIASNQSATLTATLGSSSQSATISLLAPVLVSSVACSPTSLGQSAASTCTVTLNQAAPAGGSSVTLASNNSLLTVPASLTVAAGTTSGTFAATAAASIPSNQISTASTAGLVAYWPFDEASGIIAHDASGSGNNGTLECKSNCATLPSWSPGIRNGSLNFSVAKDLVTVPDSPDLRVTNPFSFAFWVKVSAGATNISYIDKVNLSSVANGYQISTGNPGNYIYINLYNNGKEVARCNTAAGAITDQSWEHYAITYDGAHIRLYLNGVQNTVCAATASAGTDATPLSIGGPNGSSPTGIMDEVRIYNRALSAAEVANVYGDPGVVSVTASLGSSSQTATFSLVEPSSGSSSQTDAINRSALVSDATTTGNTTATAPTVRLAAQRPTSGLSTLTCIKNSIAPGSASGCPVSPANGVTAKPQSASAIKMQSISCQPGRSHGLCSIQFTNPSDSETVDLSLASSNPAIRVPAKIAVQPGQSTIRFRIDALPEWKGDSSTITAKLGTDALQQTVSLDSIPGPLGVPSHLYAKYGTQIQFRVSASDSIATLTASELPAGAVFNAASGIFQWVPDVASQGTHRVVFTETGSAGGSISATSTLEVDSGTPVVTRVVNAASLSESAACSPGAIASLEGRWLVEGQATSDASGHSTELSGTVIRVNGVEVPILSTAASRVDFLCPAAAPGSTLEIALQSAGGVAPLIRTTSREMAPGVFSLDGSGKGQAMAVHSDTATMVMIPNYQFLSRAALPGDPVTVYATGIGPAREVSVVAGGVEISPQSMVPIPDFAGMYQVSVRLPSGLADGDMPVYLKMKMSDGSVVTSNAVLVATEAQ